MSAIFHTATGVASNVRNQLQQTSSRVGSRLQSTGNRLVPPEQRKEIYKRLHLFATHNPKLAAFLGAQIILTGIPLVIFLVFAVATLFVSLTTCILLSIIIALALGFFAICIALIFLIPTIFIASCSATFIFLWGFLGYTVLRRFNRIEAFEKRGITNGERSGSWNGNANGRSAMSDEQPLLNHQTSSAKATGRTDWNPRSDVFVPHQDNKDRITMDDLRKLSMGKSGRSLNNPGTPGPLIQTNNNSDSSHGNGGPVSTIDGTQEWEDTWKNEAKGTAEQPKGMSKKQLKKEAWKKRMDERMQDQKNDQKQQEPKQEVQNMDLIGAW